jgi:hypothetical protein
LIPHIVDGFLHDLAQVFVGGAQVIQHLAYRAQVSSQRPVEQLAFGLMTAGGFSDPNHVSPSISTPVNPVSAKLLEGRLSKTPGGMAPNG